MHYGSVAKERCSFQQEGVESASLLIRLGLSIAWYQVLFGLHDSHRVNLPIHMVFFTRKEVKNER